MIAIAQSPSVSADLSINPRVLKEVELFIQDLDIKVGAKSIHNLIIYDIYKQWAKDNAVSVKEFIKTFSHYFPKKYMADNNVAFKISKKYKGATLDVSTANLGRCRVTHGIKKSKKAKEDKTISD